MANCELIVPKHLIIETRRLPGYEGSAGLRIFWSEGNSVQTRIRGIKELQEHRSAHTPLSLQVYDLRFRYSYPEGSEMSESYILRELTSVG